MESQVEDASQLWPQQAVSATPYGYYYTEDAEESYLLQQQQMMMMETAGQGEDENADQEVPDLQVRQAELALLSWGLGDRKTQKSSSNKLSISMRASDFDMKEFLAQRGNTQLHGLHKASAQGDRSSIMSIMKKEGPNAPLNELDDNSCCPLMYAAIADAVPAVEMLLNFGARRDTVDPIQRTAVHYAAFFGRHKALKFLIEAATDWTPYDLYGRTPLHWCTASKSTKCLSVLLRQGRVVMGNINPRDNEGMTPLMCAAQYNKPRHILLMNEAECDFTAADIEGRTALHWTADNTDPACIHAIIDCYPPLLNQKDINGLTVLHLAAAKGSTSVVQALLDIDGIDKDSRDVLDRTPLHYASMEGHSDIVLLLTEHRSLDSCIDKHGLTALHYAVQASSEQCTLVLSSTDYTTHVPDAEGITPLMRACQLGLPAVTKALLQNKTISSSVDYTESGGRSALHLACLAGSSECVIALTDCGADPKLQDKSLSTPIFIVCEAGHHECIRPLVLKGADIHMLDQDGDAPIHKAILYGHIDAVEALVLLGTEIDITNASGYTPLHLAVYSGMSDITRVLLQNGGNISNLTPSGLTALHLAASEGHAGAVTVLLEFGTPVNTMDETEERYTPLDYAINNEHTECSEVLQQYGGVSVKKIKTMAAISIQAAYRRHRARCELTNQKSRLLSAIIIQKWVRRFLQQLRFLRKKKEKAAAIVLQAAARGFLQRRKFMKEITKFREKEAQRKLIEDFSKMITIQTSLLRTISIDAEVPATELSEKEKQKESNRHHVAKLESGLRMRDLYIQHQRRWEEFRESERKRRVEKARQMELDRLASILSESAARRHYYQEQFEYTVVVRSHDHAAMVIQRAFKSFVLRKQELRIKRENERRIETEHKNRAAGIIQQAWRRYFSWKVYLAKNYKSIEAGPVVKVEPLSLPTPNNWRSYERGTIVSGSRRRRLHHTTQGGFKIYRPVPTLPVPRLAAPKSFNSQQLLPSPRIQRLQKRWPWFQQLVATPPVHGLKKNESSDTRLPPLAAQSHTSCSTRSPSSVTTPLQLPKIVQQ